jgi:hypothetical protein
LLLRLQLYELSKGVRATALISVGRRRGRIESRRPRLWGWGDRRVEVEDKQDQAKHSFSLQGRLAARAPLPVKRVPLRPECLPLRSSATSSPFARKDSGGKNDIEVTREVAQRRASGLETRTRPHRAHPQPG